MYYFYLDYTIFYISGNGSDDSTCGDTTNAACKTLEHVLRLYVSTSSQSGLKIITSESLTIDQHLTVRFMCLLLIFLLTFVRNTTRGECVIYMQANMSSVIQT